MSPATAARFMAVRPVHQWRIPREQDLLLDTMYYTAIHAGMRYASVDVSRMKGRLAGDTAFDHASLCSVASFRLFYVLLCVHHFKKEFQPLRCVAHFKCEVCVVR